MTNPYSKIDMSELASDTLIIGNDGQEIASTNFFDTAQASAGFFAVSCNAGAIRLLVPDSQVSYISEMATGREVIISLGPWQRKTNVAEIMFEDSSPAPFALYITEEARHGWLSPDGKKRPFTVWTRGGCVLKLSARCRFASKLPALKPWK